ncbi:MAG: hypothetical protein M1830_004705 [Pleopsidium flavum]|nr:MAG: hypothetical protein M1830_004705 [Pleopsidium flavum]
MIGISEAQAPVTVSLEDLHQDSVSFDTLERAFGPSSLGILLVKDLPIEFLDWRHKLLSYASHLANLGESELDKLSCPEAKYLVGWSRGKETLKSNHPDTLKGSYYVNCAFYRDPTLQNAPADDFPSFPEYTAPNIWPSETLLAGFRETFEDLCKLIIDTAVLVAKACDRYAVARVEGYETGYLERVVRTSLTTKARLLHYFPSAPSQSSGGTTNGHPAEEGQDSNDDDDDWCATHIDHGCLTGLTSAMYIDESHLPTPISSTSNTSSLTAPTPLPELPTSPFPTSGLYIHSRTHSITKINIPHHNLAFQTGEALELITKGKFRAVPHFVKGLRAGRDGSGCRGGEGGRVARNTLAVFTQPNLGEVVDRETGLTFGEFARGVVRRNT